MSDELKCMTEKIAKLPRWAQDHIRDIQRHRMVAVRALNEYIDSQTPSAMYVNEYECTGEEQRGSFKRRYVQGRTLTIDHSGVRLAIILRDESAGDRPCIDLQWHDAERDSAHVALIPSSFQKASLMSKGNMR